MSKEVAWTKVILETFLEESNINNRVAMGDERARILEGIMRTRVAGWSIVKQAEEFHLSTDSINKYIRELKYLYDATQRTSTILPVRKNSKLEAKLDRIEKEKNNKLIQENN